MLAVVNASADRLSGQQRAAEADQESSREETPKDSTDAPRALVAVGDHGSGLAGRVARHARPPSLSCRTDGLERSLGQNRREPRLPNELRLVQVAEEVEDEDHWQWDANQPENQSTAHDHVS
jgi:hypothetical protein